MHSLIILFLSHVVVMVVHTAGLAIAGRVAGASISEVAIFMGPAIVKIKVYGVAFRLNLLPLGSYVKFDTDERVRRQRLDDLHPLIRALIASSGCLALLLFTAVCFGPSVALHHTLSGFSQIITGALRPIAIGTQLLQGLWQFVATQSLLSTLALVASKEAAFNLLPLPSLNGGDIILNLASLVKPISESLREKLATAGMLVMLLIWLCWLIALVGFLLK